MNLEAQEQNFVVYIPERTRPTAYIANADKEALMLYRCRHTNHDHCVGGSRTLATTCARLTRSSETERNPDLDLLFLPGKKHQSESTEADYIGKNSSDRSV